jgi:hypothetical protein
MSPSRIVALGFVLCPLVACGDDGASPGAGGGAAIASSSTGAGGATGGGCDAASIAACRVDQKACELQDEGAPTCVACARGEAVDATGACVALPGAPLTHAFDTFTTAPGEEVKGLCQSWTLDNDEELWVNAVELVQDVQSHHSNWTFVPEDQFDGPDGVWPCDERGYDQLSAAVVGGVLYAQSTQAAREVQKFPDGAAVRIPPRARIIGDVHLLNVGQEAVTGRVELSIYPIPVGDVRVRLAPFHMTYEALAIPPRTRSRFEGTCSTDDLSLEAGEPFSLYYVLPHTHALGRRFFFDPVQGEGDDEVLFDVEGFDGEARGRAYDPPVELGGADGLRFGCEFDNPRDETVTWGFGDLEMCEMLGFIEAPFAFESRIEEAVPAGEVDGMPVFTGACETLVVPWDHKQGG